MTRRSVAEPDGSSLVGDFLACAFPQAFRRRHAVLASLAIALAASSPSAYPQSQTLLRLYTYPQGAYGQVAAVTWQKLIVKQSKALRLETLPSAGKEQYVDYADATPEHRRLIMLSMSPIEVALGEKGQSPWEKPAPRMKAILTFAPNSAVAIFTNDPAIRTIYDLAGKKVDLGLPGTYVQNSQGPLLVAAGVMQKIDQVPGVSINQSWQRLQDKVTSATGAGIIDLRLLPPGPADVARKTKVYMVQIPEELFKKAQEMTGVPLVPLQVKKGAFRQSYGLDYDIAREEGGTFAPAFTPGFWASPEMSDSIAYEITKIALQNIDQFGQDHALGKLLKERIGHMTVPQSEFHPGARRAYQEFRISYGLEGIKAYEANKTK